MEKTFCLKKWNGVAMWKWDVECDICAICRVQVMGKHQPLDTTSDQQSHCALNRDITFKKSHVYRNRECQITFFHWGHLYPLFC